jgi:hypothetical protein
MDVICSHEEMQKYARYRKLRLTYRSDSKWAGDAVTPHVLYPNRVEFELLGKYESSLRYVQYTMETLKTTTDWACQDPDNAPMLYAPLEVLYSLKLSHRYYPRNFKKHALDRAMLKHLLGSDALSDITTMRLKETEERIGKLKTPSLDKTAEDFFNDRVSNKLFVHDEIHAVMAHREKPMFEYYKKDASKVACSREKFEALPREARVQGVLEEAYVIALERMILPMIFMQGRPSTASEAFDWALMRICTNLCSGWFREFANSNYRLIWLSRNEYYVEDFLKAFQEGKIRRIGEANVQAQA